MRLIGFVRFGAKKPPIDQRKKSKRHRKKNYTGHTVSIYRVLKQVALESELSGEYSKTSGPSRNESSSRYFYYLGGRYDF